MSLPESTTVLIVGAGPAGLAAALSLTHHGCRDFIIVDAIVQQNTSRAVTVHAATVEVCYHPNLHNMAFDDLMIAGFSRHQCSRWLTVSRHQGRGHQNHITQFTDYCGQVQPSEGTYRSSLRTRGPSKCDRVLAWAKAAEPWGSSATSTQGSWNETGRE
jgi:glycine/D-amino acid oxidase-like deaminating enzyme